MKPSTVRGKIVSNSALILALMAAATLYSGFASFELAQSVEVLFRKNIGLDQLQATLDQTEASFSEYLRTKSSDSLKEYIRVSTKLSDLGRSLNAEIRQDETLLLERDLRRALDSFFRESESGVQAKRGRDIGSYARAFDHAGRHAQNARTLIGILRDRFLSGSLLAFSRYQSLIPGVLFSNAALVLAATLLALSLVLRYSRSITEPLVRLAAAARDVGRGDYLTEIPPLTSDDEIATMARAFSAMRDDVRQSFQDLERRAEVEKNLLEENMRVLELSHRLKDAELLALQTQINPHFLFNTLTAGLQLAGVEKADRTSAFLENLAAFIRYALTPIDRFVVVADEIECAKRYIWLLQLRFGNRYAFDVRVDESIASVELPALVLQPLIENSVSHGLADRESGGLVVVRGYRNADDAVLSVCDNGAGMSAFEIETLFAESNDAERSSLHGIGLRNVIRRIQLSTNGLGLVELKIPEQGGLEVLIRLPLGNS